MRITTLLGLSFIISPYAHTTPPSFKETFPASGHTVRVLIDEKKGHTNTTWELRSSTGFLLYESDTAHPQWHRDRDTITIQCRNNHIYLNKKRCESNNLSIVPQDGYATVNGQPYEGTFSVLFHNRRLLLINHVDLEKYVYAVLNTESWPGWPIEVNKVFAIASRTYVMAMMQQAHQNSGASVLPYDVKNTNEHQTYKGMHEVRTIRAAIAQTRGMILVYNDKPALTMFDACCGGIIPAHIKDFDFKKAPYLARTYACTHCARCQLYTWKATIPLDEFQQQVRHLLDYGNRIHDVIITQHDKAGLVQKVELHHKPYIKRVTGKQLHNACKAIKSFCFSIQKNKSNISIKGKGFGHHIGLCQWGAREMVRDGWHYKKILSFYYPGTQLVRLL